MSKILLTGASGFIGTHVRKALHEAGHEIISLVRTSGGAMAPYPGETFLTGTLAEAGALEQSLSGITMDACVHLAWEGIPDYSSEPSIKNMEYGFRVLRLCKQMEIKKLVISGSCWEYEKPSGMISENAPLSYENPFKTAKNTLHTIAEMFCRENGIAVHWLRLFYVYGEGQRPGSLIPYVVRELRSGVCPVLGGAFNQNDFVHVSDVAQAVCKSLDSMEGEPSCGTFNIGSGEAVRVLDVVAAAARILQVNIDLSLYEPPAVPPAAFWANISAAEEHLLWRPRISLKEGLERYIRFADRETI